MLRTAPFTRAPLLLTRHPAVLAAVLGTATILGLVAALTPQFLSSAASTALERELLGRCSASYSGSFGVGVPGMSSFLPVTEANRDQLNELIKDRSNLGEPIGTIEGQIVMGFGRGTPETGLPLRLFYRSGFRNHVDPIRGGGEGAWIDERAADLFGVDVGDVITFEFPTFDNRGRERLIQGQLPVSAVTENLRDLGREDYWCGVSHLLGTRRVGDPPPPMALVDLNLFGDGSMADTSDGRYLRAAEGWEIPVQVAGLSQTQAKKVLGAFRSIGEVIADDPEYVRSDLEVVDERIDSLDAALTTSVRPLALAVLAVATGLVAGTGIYWVDRRTNELRLLAALGAGPAALGVKAALETSVPVVGGLIVGTLLAGPLAGIVGPGGTIEPSATLEGIRSAVPAGIIAIAGLALVAGMRCHQNVSRRHKRSGRRSWRVPALIASVVGAYLVRDAIGESAVSFGERELVGTVDPLVILFPILVFVGAVLLISDTLARFLPAMKRRVARNHSVFLASRRIASAPTTVVMFLAGAVLPVATLLYSTALTRSAEATVEATARVFIGSDNRTPLYQREPLPASLDGVSTIVTKADRVDFGGEVVDLLAIDPETFARGAFWDPSFADLPLEQLLELLDQSNPELPAIVANAPPPADRGEVRVGQLKVPIEVVATASTFPGARIDRPVVVVSQERLDQLVAAADQPSQAGGLINYLWTAQLDADTVEAELSAAEVGFAFTTAAIETLDLTKFQAVIWTFDFLELYAGLAGTLAAAGILLYVDTRQRVRNLSYRLALRMGLTRTEHLHAGVLEIGGLLIVGAAVGVITASLTAASIYGLLDALPQSPPRPILVGTFDVAITLILAFAVLGLLAAAVAQRVADRSDVSELLRHGM